MNDLSNSISFQNFDKFCRFCLLPDKLLKPIFPEVVKIEENDWRSLDITITVSELIRTVTQLQVCFVYT